MGNGCLDLIKLCVPYDRGAATTPMPMPYGRGAATIPMPMPYGRGAAAVAPPALPFPPRRGCQDGDLQALAERAMPERGCV